MNVKKYYNAEHLKWVLWLTVSIWWLGIANESYANGTIRWSEMVTETGELTWYLLLFTVFVSLLHKLFPKVWQINNIVPLRKYTGILCWIIALTHAGSEMLNRGITNDINAIITIAFSMEHAMRFGTISFLIMLPLFLTSTNYAVKVMGYNSWKALHRITHVAFVFAGLHVLLINFFTQGIINGKTAVALTLYVVGYSIVFWRRYKTTQST